MKDIDIPMLLVWGATAVLTAAAWYGLGRLAIRICTGS